MPVRIAKMTLQHRFVSLSQNQLERNKEKNFSKYFLKKNCKKTMSQGEQ